MKGMPMADVSKFLGHKSVGITDKYYGHITDKGQDAAADALSQFIA
jgi:integrase